MRRAVIVGVLDALHTAVRTGIEVREKQQLIDQANKTLEECVRSDDDMECLLRELLAMKDKGSIGVAAHRKVVAHVARFLRDRAAFSEAVLSMLERG